MVELVQFAESEIQKRRLELSKDHGGTDEERAALVNAMMGLRVLKDVSVFLEMSWLSVKWRSGVLR
jgi:hypothetical protein